MVVDEVATFSGGLISTIGQLALWLQAIGIVLIGWIVFRVFSLWSTARRLQQISEIKKDMVRIEGKIDRLLKSKK